MAKAKPAPKRKPRAKAPAATVVEPIEELDTPNLDIFDDAGDMVNPFESREAANKFIRDAMQEYVTDYKRHRQLIMSQIEECDKQIARGKAAATAMSARAACMAQLKTLQANYTKFIENLMKSKKLLSDLDPGQSEDDKLTVIIQLPDWSQVRVVGTKRPDFNAINGKVPTTA